VKSITIFIVIILVFITVSENIFAQSIAVDSLNNSDTVKVKITKVHSPTKATIMSLVFPGLGQAYNRKYWKMPIIYAGMGISIYFATTNSKSFKKFKTAYTDRVDNDPLTVDEYVDELSGEGLKANMDYHQRNKDLSYIVAGLFYVLNIVDAAVDAHLFNFPKNDNLSFNFQPSIELSDNNQVASGFKLVINL
jgi:hypothetical protein